MLIQQDKLDAFNEVLRVVRWEFPGSNPVIGGGAIRDSILGRPIKDVDVFMRAKDHTHLHSELTKAINAPPLMQLYGRPDMHGAWDLLQTIAGYEVQLILCDFEAKFDLAETFDIGISRVTYDGVAVHVSGDFIADTEDQVFRIRRADNHHELERSLRRVSRLQQKYPEYRYEETPAARKASLGGTFE